MKKVNKEQRNFIRQLHYRNEDFFDRGLIKYEEYISNNYHLLRQVRFATLSDEQRLILVESISLEANLQKFRLGIKIAQLGFN
ncbi:hypothetical protein DRF62_02360 [Chryseobacterium piscium]|uniref:Uncharacterized protein n=1 Tax=Chryseobacterium piscium TaxID=333702 RepID=A0A3D9BUI9_9FLAO|nr:hypothetical protein [Chryseobacterium piscium]REC57021.1 hypothetical protein DRF62_02360 [Chryseobacterium piscium]